MSEIEENRRKGSPGGAASLGAFLCMVGELDDAHVHQPAEGLFVDGEGALPVLVLRPAAHIDELLRGDDAPVRQLETVLVEAGAEEQRQVQPADQLATLHIQAVVLVWGYFFPELFRYHCFRFI